MIATRILTVVFLVLAGSCISDAHAQGYAGLTAEVYYHGGDEAIPAGYPGRFRVTIRNGGPDMSTNTKVWFAWFRSGLSGTTSHAYSASPSQGMCAPVYTPDPDCYVQSIAAGSEMTIEVEGQTDPGRLTWYTLRVWVESDQAANTQLAEFSKGSSVTVAESGGGSLGWLSLIVLLVVGIARRRTVWQG